MNLPDPDRWIEESTLGENPKPSPQIELLRSPTKTLIRVRLGDLCLEAPLHPLIPVRAQKEAIVKALERFQTEPPKRNP
jgi:hypothetical protein